MWVRKRIEISSLEMARGLASCCLPRRRRRLIEAIESSFPGAASQVFLSVRSGFDLLLETSGWPRGSEILMSGLTIPDMSRIVREHGYQPVGVDLQIDTLAPQLDELRRRITPRTRAVVVAHLFGGLVPMQPVVELARQQGLVVIEDCAQAYVGPGFSGHPLADFSMFSFGPIKTNTALGGGVLVVRSPEWLARMRAAEQRRPVQSRLSFASRLWKYAVVRFLSTRFVSDVIARVMRGLGGDHDRLATKMARGFPGPDFFRKIRRQPSTPQLALLAAKLRAFDPATVERRAARGRSVAERLVPRVDVLGSQMLRPTYWVFPILVDHRQPLVERLWRLGFDATGSSSLKLVSSGSGEEEKPPEADELPNCRFILDNVVFLPFDLAIPEAIIDRMVRFILQTEAARPARPRSDDGERGVDPAGCPTATFAAECR